MPATPGERRLSTAEERRETVLRTALGAFAARGYYGTTTGEVAKSAGISQAYVYRLFPDKEALFLAVAEHCFARIRESLADGVAGARGSTPEAVLDAMGEAYARLIAEEIRVGLWLRNVFSSLTTSSIRMVSFAMVYWSWE